MKTFANFHQTFEDQNDVLSYEELDSLKGGLSYSLTKKGDEDIWEPDLD